MTIRKKDVSPEVWEAHKQKQADQAQRHSQTWDAKDIALDKLRIADLKREFDHVIAQWVELRILLRKAYSVGDTGQGIEYLIDRYEDAFAALTRALSEESDLNFDFSSHLPDDWGLEDFVPGSESDSRSEPTP